tara:strand:- start:251 stop:682 length:432 start_codon:yes stop_codon:yes gene_type:complete
MKPCFFLVFLLLLVFLVPSCSKERKVLKRMHGNWTITQYTFQNFNSFKYVYPSQGSFFFEDCSNDYCAYAISVSYEVGSISFQKNESGTYELDNDAEHYTLLRNNLDGSISNLDECRIVFINKDQMSTQIKDEFGIHHFVLEK